MVDLPIGDLLLKVRCIHRIHPHIVVDPLLGDLLLGVPQILELEVLSIPDLLLCLHRTLIIQMKTITIVYYLYTVIIL